MKQMLALGVFFGCFAAVVTGAQNERAGILELQTSSKPWPANSSGVVNLSAIIREGFKIPKRPSPKIQIDPTPRFEVRGEVSFTEEGQGKDPEYFNAFKPMSLQVLANKTTQPGRYSLTGKFVYFYCSERDKYCSRAVESVSIPIEIVAAK
jgi:hypothetical protein